MNPTLLNKLNHAQRYAWGIGIGGLVLCGLGAWLNADRFIVAYLFGFMFWLGLSLGCLAVAMIHYLTGGRWGNETRRFLEAGFNTLPLMAVLFLPLVFNLGRLYPWMQPAAVASSKALQAKAHYLNSPMFVSRAIFIFAVWIIIGWLLRRWSLRQDETTDLKPLRRMRALSGPGLIIYALTMTVAMVDWVMSLEADWYSTVFPIIACVGQILIAYAFSIVVLTMLKNEMPFSRFDLTTSFHHLGNLLLAFVIFWTYVAFGQFLVIWGGNLPHEINWYLHRVAGHWKWVVGILAVFHFFLPFLLLLFRATKRRPWALAMLAVMVLTAHALDVFWMIAPSVYQNGIQISWLDFATLFGLGGVWLALFISALKQAPLLPRNDPRFYPVIAHAK